MQIPPILRMGNRKLYQRSQEVEDFAAEELAGIVEVLNKAMIEYGGVGIAAPQIGIFKRIIIFGFDESLRYPDKEPVPHTVLINPQYTPLDDAKEYDWEGCLSIPGIRAKVPRYKNIMYNGFDINGKAVQAEAHDFAARIIQHECDHLDGILFISLVEDLHDLGFEDEMCG